MEIYTRMRKAVWAIGLIPLGIAPVVLLVTAALGGAQPSLSTFPVVPWIAALPAVTFVGYIVGLEADAALRTGAGGRRLPGAAEGVTVLAVAGGALVTRVLAVDLGLGVIVAAALVGLVADRVAPSHGAAVYCGTFVGMASPVLLPDAVSVAAAGLVAGMVFVAGDGVFDGFGGKLGTAAFVGCVAVASAFGASSGVGTQVALPTVVGYALAGAAAAGVTSVYSVRLGHGPVQASALVGLVGGLVCPPLLPAGEGLAGVVFCASFAGMARPTRVPGAWTTATAGAVCGLLVAATSTVFVGFGGKLGTIAFAACLIVRGLLAAGTDTLPASLPTPTDGLRS